MTNPDRCDVVLIGAGSAGCGRANPRPSVDPDIKVSLREPILARDVMIMNRPSPWRGSDPAPLRVVFRRAPIGARHNAGRVQ
jgi:hypothetical protein